MVQFNLLVVFIGVIFSFLLVGSYFSFHKFYERINPFKYWDITCLASAKSASLESSELLSSLQASYNLSIENFHNNKIDIDGEISVRNSLIDNFAQKLTANLHSTLDQGLNFNETNGESNNQQYQNYAYQLIHSNYLPDAILETSKKYNSTLIGADKVTSIVSAADIEKLNDSGRLVISEQLLKTLVGDEASLTIKSNPNYFATLVTDDGLDLQKLPNGLKLNIKFDSDLDKTKVKLNEKNIFATAQIKINNSTLESKENFPRATTPILPEPSPTPQLPVTNPPINPLPVPGSGSEPVIQEIEFSLLPIDKRVIVYDPNKPIDQNNPIRIINTKEGGYSLLFVGSDGYINIGIGDIKTSSLNNTNSLINNQTSFSSATLTLVGQSENISLANNAGYSIKMDTLPRGRKRYTTVDQSFVVNGITIPQGFIIVASKEEGTGGRPSVDKFEDFRVYDPQSGALITYFGQNALQKANGNKGQYFSFDKFYTVPGTKHQGADIYEMFSVSQLFPGLTPNLANQLWINIQGDLERETKLDINSSSEPWQEKILKDLNEDEMVYLGHELRYESLSRLKEIFGFTNVSYKDDYARQLDDAQFLALKNYAAAKIEYWSNEKNPAIKSAALNLLKENRERAKELYLQARMEFSNYIKYNILPEWLKPKTGSTTNTQQNSNTNQPSTKATSTTTGNTNNSSQTKNTAGSNKANNTKKKK